MRHAAARLQGDQVLPGDERVRRAGHRLDGQRPPALRLGQRVSGEYLKPAVTLASPERDLAAGPAEPGPGPAAGIPDQAGERMIEARAADRAGNPEVLRGAG